MQSRLLPFVTTITIALTGCGANGAIQGLHHAATVAHEATNSTYEVLDELRPDIMRQAREEVVSAYESALREFAACRDSEASECEDPGTPEEWAARWEEEVSAFYLAEDAVYTADSAIVSLSQALIRWQQAGQSRETPDYVHAACTTLAVATRDLIAALERFGHDPPEVLSSVPSMITAACGQIGGEDE
jgi:hypothetical protein